MHTEQDSPESMKVRIQRRKPVRVNGGPHGPVDVVAGPGFRLHLRPRDDGDPDQPAADVAAETER